MWRKARQYAALTYYDATETALRLIGKRRPYSSLRVVLKGDLSEQAAEPRLLGLPQREREDFFALLSLLRWASEDADLRGVLVRCDGLSVGWAKIQELRRALLTLRQAGKTVWVYCTQIGLPEYVLASVADRIVIAPAGSLDITGLSSEVTFIGGALKKLGIEAEVVHIGKYKSAAETFTRSDMSDSNREMVESLVQDLFSQACEAIAEGRALTVDKVRELIDGGPFTAIEAQRDGLVDALLYEDQVQDQLKAHCGELPLLEQQDYTRRRGRLMHKVAATRAEATIGIAYITGTIRSGESVSGIEGASSCGDTSVARDLKELRERDDVKAVVLRVSSPGGSGLASDLIWHEVQRTREKKPVVVSFGDVAASGGYYIGVAGKPIFAEAGTLTGSIGVLAGKAALKGLLDQLGITREVISYGRNASLHSSYLPMTPGARERLQAEAQFFYSEFVGKVAAGRDMSIEAVDEVAQGRVWTGKQAHQHGLIDGIGGIQHAIQEAKVLAGIAPGQVVRIDRYPHPKRLWKMALNLTPPSLRLTALFPSLPIVASERIWAVLPIRFRFF